MRIRSILNKLGLREGEITDHNYELSRRKFIIEGCLANGIATLTGGAFLVGYATYLGASDQYNGILLSLPLLTFILQMFSPFFLEKMTSRKKLVVITCLIYRLLMGLMVLIPVIAEDRLTRLILLAVMFFVGNVCVSFSNPAGGSWIISLVPDRIRGSYFGLRDMCILSSAAVLSFAMGRVLDYYKANSQEYTGFVIIFSVTLILVVLNFLTLRKIREPEIVPLKQELKLKSMLVMPIRNKMFRKVVIINIVWNISAQIALPFFSVYMVTGLKLSYTFIMILGIVLSIVQALSAKVWGRISEKISWELMNVISVAMIGTCHLLWVLVDKQNCYYLIPVIQVFAGMAWAGVNLSFFNIQFKYAPQEGRTIFIGFNTALAGISGFMSASLGAVLVGALSGVKINIGITTLDNMLLVFGISGALILCCSLFASRFFKVKLKLKND